MKKKSIDQKDEKGTTSSGELPCPTLNFNQNILLILYQKAEKLLTNRRWLFLLGKLYIGKLEKLH